MPSIESRAFVEQEIPTDWGSLSYLRSEGDGVPLLLLHPLALGARMWEPIAGELGPGRDIIAVDVRGHGNNRWDGKAFAIEDLADDLVVLLDALGIPRIDMAGMSMGGCIAIAFAAAHPERVERLALCDTTACYGPEAATAWEERALAAESKPRAELIPFQTQRWFSDRFRAENEALVGHTVEVFLGTSAAAHAQACRALGAFDGRDRVGAIKATTLVVTGEEDYATPPAMGRDLAERIPGAVFRLWPDVRHFSVLESAALRAFVAQHLAPGVAGR